MGTLCLVPIYFGTQQGLLSPLSQSLSRIFGVQVKTRPPWFDPEATFDSSRGQYHSTQLVQALLSQPEGQGLRILGVTSVDLYVPVLTYVFGEAQLQGRAAVVSMHRLRNELYGLPADEELLQKRFIKEAIHEMGHTFGLVHCSQSRCVMHGSTYVEEIDLKLEEFCSACAESVARQSSLAFPGKPVSG
ncbi:MAG TPA: archaemetzincin family Zn-dependent metalloprotease [Bdellovibrionota bacterium]|nr:archaemetzincin family Zn-dependent metalloprotease [Bdellovibrionota bacterium]